MHLLSDQYFVELVFGQLWPAITSFEVSQPLSGPLYPKLSTCFEGTQLTQLVQLVTADRLFLIHKGQVDPLMYECLYHNCKFWSQRILTPSKPLSHHYSLEWEEIKQDAEGTQDITCLDLRHDEGRRARKS